MISRAKLAGRSLILPLMLMSVPAVAQMDFAGEWTFIRHEDIEPRDPLPGEYVGLPINDAARMLADTWTPSRWSLPEWQCRAYGANYQTRSLSRLRISKEEDPWTRGIAAFHVSWDRAVGYPIYLDNRPHPPEYAPHTWAGFSTAEWIGDILKITTTHIKENYIKRVGLRVSDKATLTQYWIRRGELLTWVIITHDPAYLTEPYIRSTEYRLDLRQQLLPFRCTILTESNRPKGDVPHFFPGTNPNLKQFSSMFDIPYEATRGGAETMYPEYQGTLKQLMEEDGAGK